MGVIPSRYSPVRTAADGRVTVELAGDHPGVTDPGYRARRDHLAGLAAAWRAGEPIPTPDYTEEEHGVWAAVSSSLEELHDRYACPAFLEGKATLRLPVDRVPQLPEVTACLQPVAGFRYLPIAGLAPLPRFLRVVRRGSVLVDPVSAPPVGAALHTRARRHPRGHRARQPAGWSGLRRPVPAGRGGRGPDPQ